MVLIGSDGHEACFWEGEGAEVSVGVEVTVRCWIHKHNMETWLVAMHGVQYHLAGIRRKETHISHSSIVKQK